MSKEKSGTGAHLKKPEGGKRTPPDHLRCKGKARTTGERCRDWKLSGREFCRRHGGRAPRGLAHPRFKTGLWSKALPESMLVNYVAELESPDHLSMKRSIALIGAFIGEMIPRLNTGESIETWEKLVSLKGQLVMALRNDNKDRANQLMPEIIRTIEKGGEHQKIMREIGYQIDRYKSLKEAEAKRLVAMQQTITAEKANVLMGVLVTLIMGALRKHLDDRTARTIYADISQGIDAHIIGDVNNPRALNLAPNS